MYKKRYRAKHYTGHPNMAKKIIGTILLIIGLICVFGGVGGIEQETMGLLDGTLMGFGGCALVFLGGWISGAIG